MNNRDTRFRRPVLYDIELTDTPTPLWPTSLNFTGWITASAGNSGNVTFTTPFGTATRVAYQADWFENVDLNLLVASGDEQVLCISGVQ